jgi:predicted SnoaL-like aldol condensation-catalyzing enzyme
MAKQGIVMKYDKIHGLVGEGNFVLVVSEGVFARNPTSFYDLFRVENGKLAEHWDVMEMILPKMNGRMVTGSSNNTLKNQ